MPAGRVLVVVVVALLVAALLNSEAMVKATDAMPAGITRTVLRPVAHSVDAVSRTFRITSLRHELDQALGRQDKTAGVGLLDPNVGQPVAIPSGGLPAVTTSASTSAAPSASPAAAASPVRDVSSAAPLKLFITGDSMIEFMAGRLVNLADDDDALEAKTEVKYGTGLVRPDFFDWLPHAETAMAERQPDAVLMMMGGNDGQNIQLPDKSILTLGSPEWIAEYQRRAVAVMTALTGSGLRRVYWVGMPPARSARLFNGYRALNTALAGAAALVPGATYIPTWDLFVNGKGEYSDYLDDESGKPVLMRARDGIHLSKDGAQRLAKHLLPFFEADWKLNS